MMPREARQRSDLRPTWCDAKPLRLHGDLPRRSADVAEPAALRAAIGQNFSGLACCTCGSARTLREHVRRHLAVDLDQRDGVAARRFAADVEGRDVDAGVAQRGGEACR